MEGSGYFYTAFLGNKKPGREIPGFEDAADQNGRYYYDLRVYSAGPDNTSIEYRGNIPNHHAISDATFRQLPRFLYRISSTESGGSSKVGLYKSQSVVEGFGGVDFGALEQADVKERLTQHLRNRTTLKNQRWRSPFISMTDSFMTAVYWGNVLRRKRRTNIKLHIIDTHKIQEPALIFHAYALAKAYRVGDKPTSSSYPFLIRPTYTEFLIWEKIKVHSSAISFKALWMPEYFAYDTPWAIKFCDDFMWQCLHHQRVEQSPRDRFRIRVPYELREKLYPNREKCSGSSTDFLYGPRLGQRQKTEKLLTQCTEMDINILKPYIRMARLVPIEFQLELLIVSLSMLTWHYTDESIVEQVCRTLKDDPMCAESEFFGTGLMTSMKHEVYKQQELMEACYRNLGKKVVYGGQRPLRNVHILRSNGPSGRPTIHTIHSLVQARELRTPRLSAWKARRYRDQGALAEPMEPASKGEDDEFEETIASTTSCPKAEPLSHTEMDLLKIDELMVRYKHA